MKFTTALTSVVTASLLLSLSSCNDDPAVPQSEDSSEKEAKKSKTASVPSSKKEAFLEITFAEGALKGTHRFKFDDAGATAGAGVREDEGYSDIAIAGVTSDTGYQLSHFNRLVVNTLQSGDNAPMKADDCGGITFHDRDQSNANYDKIFINFTTCTPTTITGLGEWAQNPPYEQRGVTGKFSDTASFEFRTDDGNTQKFDSPVEVTFGVFQKQIKK